MDKSETFRSETASAFRHVHAKIEEHAGSLRRAADHALQCRPSLVRQRLHRLTWLERLRVRLGSWLLGRGQDIATDLLGEAWGEFQARSDVLRAELTEATHYAQGMVMESASHRLDFMRKRGHVLDSDGWHLDEPRPNPRKD